MPLVSIVVPVYNASKFLKETLDSLVCQTIQSFEIVCINDGSTDSSGEILEEYKNKHPNIFVVKHISNSGEMLARNAGIAAASGEYIGFCDSDDFVMPDMYENLYNAIVERHADMAICAFQRVDETGHVYVTDMSGFCNVTVNVEDDYTRLAMMNPAPWNKLFKADIAKKMLEMQKKLEQPPKVAADLIPFITIFPYIKKIAYVDKVLYKYVIRQGSIIRTVSVEKLDYAKSVMVYAKKETIKSNSDIRLSNLIDLVAFIHFGISFPFYMSKGQNVNLKKESKKAIKYLDDNFNSWRSSPYLSFGYIFKHNKRLLKPAVVRVFMMCGLLPQFLFIYNFILDTFKIDIKW